MYFRFPKVLMPIGPVRIASTSLSPTLKLFTHLHFHPNMASTSTMFSSLPSNVNERRMELFNLGLDAKLSIPGSELEKLWPFLDNMCVHYCKNAAKTHTTSYYRCRLWRDDPIPVKVTPEIASGFEHQRLLLLAPARSKLSPRAERP